MAVTTYGTLDQLKTQLRIPDTDDDTFLTAVLGAVSRELDDHCRGSRSHFYQDDTASARVFQASSNDLIEVADISTSTGLVVKTDDDEDGTFETTWASMDYQLEPLDGITDERAVWKIRAIGDLRFPVSARATVQVTARWGWAQVPDPIVTGSLIQAARIANRRSSPFGIVEDPALGTSERLFAALDPDVKMLVRPYVKNPTGN